MLGFLYGSTGLVHKESNVTYSRMQQTAVVVFPTPSELKSRAAKRFAEMGKEVPAEAVNEMTGTWTCTHYYLLLSSNMFTVQLLFSVSLHPLLTSYLKLPFQPILSYHSQRTCLIRRSLLTRYTQILILLYSIF